MFRTAASGAASMLWLTGCVQAVAFVGAGAAEQAAHRHCEHLPTLDQRNQCLRAIDTTTPQDLKPRRPWGTPTAPEPVSDQDLQRRREALCIRREGAPAVCPN